jgi:lactate 2-monooxygenase
VPNFGDYQNEIYLGGMMGAPVEAPMSFAALEAAAQAVLAPDIFGYVAGSAGDEQTARVNVSAFDRWGLMPRMMVGGAQRDLSVTLFGRTYASPLFLCPVGVLPVCRDDGDLEVARAAKQAGVLMLASTLSGAPLEDVAAELGDAAGFFQLYTPNDRELAESFVHRAEAAGFAGLVVTVDTWVNGWRPRDLSSGYLPMLRGLCLANYRTDPRFAELVAATGADQPFAVERTWAQYFGKPTLNWDDLTWLRSLTRLPLLVKGICAPEDARRARDLGADGIICSNHGGRQANGGLPALACLPGVVEAVDGLPVLFDSGVRNGAHIVKALALGATMVGIGRPYVYGLAIGGAAGVVHVVRSLLAETDLTMAVDGYPSIADLTPAALLSNP